MNRVCEQCGKGFQSAPAKVKIGHGRFCSKTCKGSALRGESSPLWKDRPQKSCQRCGGKFRYSPSQAARKHCSKKCADDAKRSDPGISKVRIPRKRTTPTPNATRYGTCIKCGNPLSRKGRKYCSRECFTADQIGNGRGRNTRSVRCIICHAPFDAHVNDLDRGMGKFCSRRCYHMFQSSNEHNKNSRGKGGRRDDLDGLYVRSRWEANWARYLNWLQSIGQIQGWEYEPDTFSFEKIKRGQRFYTPDFKVTNADGSIEYHEVKGYMDQPSKTKLKRMAKYYPGITILIIDEPVYKDVAKKIGKGLDHWE